MLQIGEIVDESAPPVTVRGEMPAGR